MKITAIIPARYASTRFEGKALADIQGKPMVQHVYERTARASLVSEVIVATDDERIFAAVRGFGGRVEMTGKGMKPGPTGWPKWRRASIAISSSMSRGTSRSSSRP